LKLPIFPEENDLEKLFIVCRKNVIVALDLNGFLPRLTYITLEVILSILSLS